jgi:hypothetical protein
MVWHYANWRLMPEVVANQRLRATTEKFATGLPLLWFTSDQLWDRTLLEDVLCSVRFGLRADDTRLRPSWLALASPGANAVGFVATHLSTGAEHQEWFATHVEVPLDELAFEVLQDGCGDWAGFLDDEGRAWRPADPAVVARAHLADEHRARAERNSVA